MTYPMSTIAHALLRSQRITHIAAVTERRMLTTPALDLIVYRDQVAAMHAESRRNAELFAIGAELHPAAND
ncbi:hypothetical protein [Variovorax sp. dw_954]|uniref:hypothetical protein n=1 Tax=Variovorax sp. dw_954 TaxID=2720078 RepID=UPI001BD27D0D|nr:hypothetical protein [Variovorax sp. dw_954]